jgi:hypothetical protein
MDDDTNEYAQTCLLDATRANGERFAEVLDLDLGDDLVRKSVAHLCTRLFFAGFRVGVGNVLKQADEQGVPLTLNIDEHLFDDDGPLCRDEEG